MCHGSWAGGSFTLAAAARPGPEADKTALETAGRGRQAPRDGGGGLAPSSCLRDGKNRHAIFYAFTDGSKRPLDGPGPWGALPK